MVLSPMRGIARRPTTTVVEAECEQEEVGDVDSSDERERKW